MQVFVHSEEEWYVLCEFTYYRTVTLYALVCITYRDGTVIFFKRIFRVALLLECLGMSVQTGGKCL